MIKNLKDNFIFASSNQLSYTPFRQVEMKLNIDFHGNNNPQFYIFDLQSFA